MKNCWGLLQMQPTNDVEAIKRARRLLIREWHPDIATGAEDKQRRALRCSEINAACDEAVRLANGWKRTPADPVISREAAIPRHHITRTSFTVNLFSWLFAIGILLCILFARFIFGFLFFFMPFLVGASLIGFIDLLLFRLVIKRLLLRSIRRTSVGEYQDTLAWFLLFFANIVILRFWLSQVGDRLFGEVLGPVFTLGIVIVVPLWRLMRWSKQLIDQNRNKERIFN
jgi:hypothetical protein